MAQLEGNGSDTYSTPKGRQSPTFEQLLKGDATWHLSTSPAIVRHHDHEEDFSPNNSSRKSVLTRVKEKAKKLRQSLSVKKKHDNEILDGHTTPSWGVSLEDNDDDDDDEEDEDPEYLGAPMYESELAPEPLKETARQHPRANPVVAENHIWPTSAKCEEKETPVIHNKTITEAVSEKLAPAYHAVSDATQTIASKIAGLTISGHTEQQKHSYPDTAEHSTADGMKNLDKCPEVREHLSPQKWDKGVSVKEYFMNKLEPGEDDKALSQVISEAISPKKTPTDIGMVEKVREAVTSFLRHEEPLQSFPKGSMAQPSRETNQAANLRSNTHISANKEVLPPNTISSANENWPYLPMSNSSSSVEEPSKQTIKAKNLSSTNPVSTGTKGLAPNSISSVNVHSPSGIPVSHTAREPASETIKEKKLSSSVPMSTKAEVRALHNSPISHGGITVSHTASSIAEPASQTIKEKNLSSRVPFPTKAEVRALHSPISHGASIMGEKTAKSPKHSSNVSSSAKTEVQRPNFIFSSSANRSSNFPISRSKSLSSHASVPHSANSSPLIPISRNAQEAVVEEETHGRILQTN